MKVVQTFVRGCGNCVFYVEQMEKRENEKDKKSKFVPAGFQVKIKGYKMNPIVLENWPTNEDLIHLSQRYR